MGNGVGRGSCRGRARCDRGRGRYRWAEGRVLLCDLTAGKIHSHATAPASTTTATRTRMAIRRGFHFAAVKNRAGSPRRRSPPMAATPHHRHAVGGRIRPVLRRLPQARTAHQARPSTIGYPSPALRAVTTGPVRQSADRLFLFCHVSSVLKKTTYDSIDEGFIKARPYECNASGADLLPFRPVCYNWFLKACLITC